ncbi:MAG TPA: hypothetical protein VEQ40_02125, partial [Pyrinomonadaceae bacterium]|nr:hypothetical protein [Pyrinomonadaceae bacterium]
MQWSFKGYWVIVALSVVGAAYVMRRAAGKRKLRRGLVLFAGAILAWIGFDLYAPRRTDIRRFNPQEVARLETMMWRSYYERRRLRLFAQMAELLRAQYRLPLLRSNVVAYQAARAAFVFKDGRSREDYERALPYLENFYAALRRVSNIAFNPQRAARLELEWWIVHRERAQHGPHDLVGVLAAEAAEIYQAPLESMLEHARLRAEAMAIRDTQAEHGALTENDWARINEL